MHGLLLSLLAGTALAKNAIEDYDVLRYIDPLIGSSNGGTCGIIISGMDINVYL
jgi:hypothetical protein